MKNVYLIIIVCFVLAGFYLFFFYNDTFGPKINEEFEIRGLLWRTVSYYYHPGIYSELYSPEDNLSLISKAKATGANYLLIRAFYNGTEDGGLVGNEEEAKAVLKEAIDLAHQHGMRILLVPYVESRDYWTTKQWVLSENLWTETVLKWARFAQENKVGMFAPGVEMNIIFPEETAATWLKEILPRIREVYKGKIVTAEHYDIEKWKALDEAESFKGYDCLGFTLFPRKEYDGVSDMRSFKDYRDYIEKEAQVIDTLSEKYDIPCKLAIPMGLDYWRGSYPGNPVPPGDIIAQASRFGLDILKEHNFTGVFISHWASEPDHLGNSKEVEKILQERWTK